MLNSCFDKLYRILGLRGGGFYPYFVAVAIFGMNTPNLLRKALSGLTPSLKVVTRIECALRLLYPVTCILESCFQWKRFRKHHDALERIRKTLGSNTRFQKFTLVQQVFLLIYPAALFLLEEDAMGMVATIPAYLALLINYAAVVRYSSLIWTIEDLFKHLNYRLDESLAYQKSCRANAISRICTIHKSLVDHATEINATFQIQILVSLLVIIVRCILYPSIALFKWLDPHTRKYTPYIGLGFFIIDLLHVICIFHPPSMAVLQARKTTKILRSIANKQVLDCETVRFFLKRLMLQDLKFSLFDLVELDDLNIILVIEYITTRLFILITF